MNTVSIEAANAAEAEEVCAGLRGFNACAVRGLDFVPLWLVVRDASGALQGAWWARSTWAGCRLMRSGLQNQYVAWERGLRYSGRRKSERLKRAQLLPIWILSIGRRLASMKGMATPNSAGWKISRQARRDCSCRRSSWRFIRMTKWAWSADDPPSCASVSL